MGPINRNRIMSLLAVCVLTSLSALSQSGGDYILDWSTIDGGGGTSRGGQYVLTGTIGQPDASYSGAGGYELLGGFWPGGPLCFVYFDDLAQFCAHWLDTADSIGADLDYSQNVDFIDYGILAHYWLLDCPYKWPLR